MKDRYVLDSCIWIDIHRQNEKILSRVQPLIDNNEICLVDVIAVEVLRGTRTPQEYRQLKAAFLDFPVITTRWEKVGDLAFAVAQAHFQPPLIDLYIAQAVLENDKTLITRDKHFPQIVKVRSFGLQMIV